MKTQTGVGNLPGLAALLLRSMSRSGPTAADEASKKRKSADGNTPGLTVSSLPRFAIYPPWRSKNVMKYQFAAVPILLAWTCQCLPAVDVLWTKQPGLGLHISGNVQGDPWAIGVDEVVSGNYSIHRFNGTAWVRQPGSGRPVRAAASRSPPTAMCGWSTPRTRSFVTVSPPVPGKC